MEGPFGGVDVAFGEDIEVEAEFLGILLELGDEVLGFGADLGAEEEEVEGFPGAVLGPEVELAVAAGRREGSVGACWWGSG